MTDLEIDTITVTVVSLATDSALPNSLMEKSRDLGWQCNQFSADGIS